MTLSVDAIISHIVWFFFAGLVIVGFLLGAFKLGQRVRAKEPPPPPPRRPPPPPRPRAGVGGRGGGRPGGVPQGGRGA
ncbi:DUF6479 family protein, partial [Streptomyces goshikiensis]